MTELEDAQALARMVKSKVKSAYNALDELRRLTARLEGELAELELERKVDTPEGGNDEHHERRIAEGDHARAASHAA